MRATVANYEAMEAAALRRSLLDGQTRPVVRISDTWVLAASMAGKIELDSVEDADEGAVIEKLVAKATLDVFRSLVSLEELRGVVGFFDDGAEVAIGPDATDAQLAKLLHEAPGLAEVVDRLEPLQEEVAKVAAVEFLLEGLHLSKRLNKYVDDDTAIFAKRMR